MWLSLFIGTPPSPPGAVIPGKMHGMCVNGGGGGGGEGKCSSSHCLACLYTAASTVHIVQVIL